MSARRMRRVDEAVREVCRGAIPADLKDPRVGFVTVTDVKTSPDLRHARVFVSVLGDDAGSASATPRRAARPPTASCSGGSPASCTLKRTPTLEFAYDDTADRGDADLRQLLDEEERGR